MLNRNITTINADYTGSFGIEDFCPAWQFKAGGNYYNRNRRTSVYPYYRLQDIWNYSVYTSISHNILCGKNQYGVALNACYGTGGGTPKDDKAYDASQNLPKPQSLDNFLYREYEYLTAPRIQGNIGIAYSRLLNPAVRGYIRANCELTNALNTEHIEGKTHGSATLAIGCTF
jgi:hypothetical protein